MLSVWPPQQGGVGGGGQTGVKNRWWGEGGEIIDLRNGDGGRGARLIHQSYKWARMRGGAPVRVVNASQILCGATYNVLSFGMWLKLATDSRLMLLLLRVLRGGKNTTLYGSIRLNPAILRLIYTDAEK